MAGLKKGDWGAEDEIEEKIRHQSMSIVQYVHTDCKRMITADCDLYTQFVRGT